MHFLVSRCCVAFTTLETQDPVLAVKNSAEEFEGNSNKLNIKGSFNQTGILQIKMAQVE